MTNNIADQINQYIANPLFLSNQNPIAFIKFKPSFQIKFIAFNKKWNTYFPVKNIPVKPHTYFENNFTIFSKPVNISGSKDIIKLFFKKTEQYYKANLHNLDNEHFYLEIIKKDHTEVFGYSNKKELYRILDLFPEVIFKLDKQLNFDYLNQHGLAIFGFKKKDLKKPIALKDIVYEQHYDQIHTFIEKLSGNKKSQSKTLALKRNENGHGYFDIFFSAMITGKDAVSIWGIAIDITHKKNIEKKLLKAKTKVEEADRLKTIFLMNMSHEIRTPLNSVMGYTQLLMRKVKDPVLANYLQNIKTGSKELLKLFNDLLDLSKIYANQLDIIESEVNLNRLLLKLEKEYKIAIELEEKDIELNCICSLQNDESQIIIDSDRIQQIFNSLFSNSLKFTQAGSIEFGYQKSNKVLHFFLKDTGKGIEPQFQKQIFDLFYQPELSTNGENRGTGIGLAITKGIIEKMNGKVWIESTIDKGTMINFILPFNSSSKKTTKSIHGDLNMEYDLQKCETLIIENNYNNLYILKEMLEKSNAKVSLSNSGKNALEVDSSIPYDLILIDINLTDINGIEQIKTLRKNHSKSVIIALSAYFNNDDKLKHYEAGCDAFIEKPINQEQFLCSLSNFLTKKNR